MTVEFLGNNQSILIFCDVTSGGGVYVYTKNLINMLNDQGFNFYLLTHEPKNESDVERLEKLTPWLLGYRLIHNGVSEKKILDEVNKYLEEIKPRYYIPNYRNAPHAAVIGAKVIGCQTIFVAHNDHFDQYKYAVRYQNQIDFFISPSKKAYETLGCILEDYNKSKVWYIPHCIDSRSSYLPVARNSNSKLRLLYNGRIVYEQKQLHFLPLIAKELDARGIEFQMNIIGDGVGKERLHKAFHDLGMSDDKIIFAGYVPHEQVLEYIHNSDVAILVSSYEGFCLGLAEAMSQGLPCVAFSCGGVIDDYVLNGKSGFLIEQGNVFEFTNKIEILSKDENLYRQMSTAAAKIIDENFNRRLVTNLYKELLSKPIVSPAHSWPLLRPVLICDGESVIEKIGSTIFRWPLLKRDYQSKVS